MFVAGGYLARSVAPASRDLERMCCRGDKVQSWRTHLKRLKEKGLIEGELGTGRWEGRITGLGRTVFAGGRQPELAWDRQWDGRWRLLSFELPRGRSAVRMKLRRWLMARHYGRLQRSVWIGPDPVADLDRALKEAGMDAEALMVFEGNLVGSPPPAAVAALAWDFAAINAGYRRYVEVTHQALQQLRNKREPLMERVRAILRTDRKLWLEAVGRDPLLPRAMLPADYGGEEAWKVRGRLMGVLGGLLTEEA